MFIDSQLAGNVYCDESSKISATNVDDIVELVRDFPIRILGQIGDRNDSEKIIDRVKNEEPALIVMHLGAFEGNGGKTTDVDKMTVFLKKVIDVGFKGRLIIYSRKPSDLKKIRDTFFTSKLIDNLVLVELESDLNLKDKNDENCFAQKSVNGSRLVRAIQSAIRFDGLYSSN